MKKILAAVLFLVSPAVFANPYNFPITRVLDGDTVEFQATFLPPVLGNTLKIRVLGVDTPEKAPRAKCPQEAQRGQMATDFTKKVIANARSVYIELKEWDKFGGRVLGDVIVDNQRLSTLLIQNGLARPYFGEAKQSWCN